MLSSHVRQGTTPQKAFLTGKWRKPQEEQLRWIPLPGQTHIWEVFVETGTMGFLITNILSK